MDKIGITDKTGKKYIVGSILKYDDEDYMSKWVSGEIAVIVDMGTHYSARMSPFDRKTGMNQNILTEEFSDCTTIIGHIDENPELLE